MRSLVEDAERQIASILKKLEQYSGLIVKDVHINAIDATSIDSDSQFLELRVRIETERTPGHGWEQAE